MPLPQGFSEFEHLQDVIRRVQNRIVKDEFSDLGDDNWDENINTGRASLRVACTHKDDDTGDMLLMRLWLYYIILRKAQDLQMPIYGIPVNSFQEERKFKPQVKLYFLEDLSDVEDGYSPVTGEITFRVMDEESETLTETKVRQLANKIKTNFANSGGFRWRKGKYMASYVDKPRGYQMQLLCLSKVEAKRIIEQILDIQGHSPNWKFMNISENELPTTSYPTIPPTELILGKRRRLPRRRPTAIVRFQYAVLNIWGVPMPIPLVDRTRRFKDPVVEIF